MQDGNIAAPAENAGTEAPTSTNEQTPAQAPAPTQENAAPALTEEQQAALKFIESNGGLDKVKRTITARTNAQPQQPQQPQQPTQTQQPIQPQEPVQPQQPVQQTQPQQRTVPSGYQTMDEFMIEQYYNNLANKPEYAPISDKIRSGEVLKEMAKFNIRPVVDGLLNKDQVRDFLDMYVKTVPATQTSAPVTSTPTVDYYGTDKEVASMDDVHKILAQSGNPKREEALKFWADQINGKK